MGYRVEYPKIKKLRGLEKRACGTAALTGLCFALFLLVVNMAWPEGAAVLRRLVFWADAAVTAAAFETFCQEMQEGETVLQAFGTFWETVVRGVKLAAN